MYFVTVAIEDRDHLFLIAFSAVVIAWQMRCAKEQPVMGLEDLPGFCEVDRKIIDKRHQKITYLCWCCLPNLAGTECQHLCLQTEEHLLWFLKLLWRKCHNLTAQSHWLTLSTYLMYTKRTQNSLRNSQSQAFPKCSADVRIYTFISSQWNSSMVIIHRPLPLVTGHQVLHTLYIYI